MERLRFFIFTLLLSLSFTTVDAKYVEIVHDKKTLEAYTANVTYVNITEDYHNRLIDRTRKKKEKIAEYHATMESIKELYRFSMQNIKGFGYESAYYKQMGKELARFPNLFAKAFKGISDSPFYNSITTLSDFTDMQLEVVGLVEKFIDIVNNGKVDLSQFTSGKNDKITQLLRNAHTGKGDGYNFLDRNQRVGLAMGLLQRLQNINYKLENMIYICNCCNRLRDVFYSIDPEGWCRAMGGYMSADYVVKEWQSQMSTF